MRLVAYEFAGADAPVASGFIALGDVTVLFGPNDVGKSRLLSTIANGARSLDDLIEGRPARREHRFTVQLEAEDTEQLLNATYARQLDEDDDGPPSTPDGRSAWLAMADPSHRAALSRSSVFALEALDDWCGKPPTGRPGLLVSWLHDIGPLAGAHSFSGFSERATRIGTIDLPALPMPVHVPSTDPGWLRQQLADALEGWLAHVLWAMSTKSALEWLRDAWQEVEGVDDWIDIAESFARRVEDRPAPETLWTVRDEGSVACRPLALAGCRHLSELATSLAPDFLKERYQLEVKPQDLLRWREDDPVVVSLVSAADGSVYDHSSVADGLRLWAEIALLEAADAMRRAELGLRHALFEIEAVVYNRRPAGSATIDRYLRLLDEAASKAVDPPFQRTLGAAFALASGVDSPWRDENEPAPKLVQRVSAVRPRLYLLDEPERHLNPRLQRAAARWLIDLLRTRGSQGLIATHAHAFLSAGSDTRFVHVRRTFSGRSELIPFSPDELTAYSDVAEDMGLDRGELLTNIEVILFVEGRHDQVVLDELFGSRFHRAGIVTVPIAGVGRHAQIVEHEVLVKFTRARLAVVFDKLEPAVIQRLLDDADFRQESLRSRDTELNAMASLLQNAAVNDRTVQPFALPVDDIFDALDEEVLRDQFPKYPGHGMASEEWQRNRRDNGNRKRFYEDRYDVPNHATTYKRIAALMRTLDRIPQPLTAFATEVERFAFPAA
ncbi:hypothetical protein [Capillimicrobium parvum]|uniref:ATP-dependent endonuclease n=1 Tax=Capillimicrobium parvum TaxID=2884022 RepID=A0A9E7C0F2_9ACTN|nr:hypothetical protein [Capillimicrobium parvum]UGS35338.1 hypothetical protein DSM104329_01725 [Capillimicrobium parvum]